MVNGIKLEIAEDALAGQDEAPVHGLALGESGNAMGDRGWNHGAGARGGERGQRWVARMGVMPENNTRRCEQGCRIAVRHTIALANGRETAILKQAIPK